jgi:hypothetical protein
MPFAAVHESGSGTNRTCAMSDFSPLFGGGAEVRPRGPSGPLMTLNGS